MITVKLWGGLGNQLFQYAYAYKIAKNINTKLALDISWFKRQKLRSPEILGLKIKYDEIFELWDTNYWVRMANWRIPNILLRIPEYARYKIGNLVYLKESRFRYSKKVDCFYDDNAYLDGYWQCPVYFANLTDEIRSLYVPKEISEEAVILGEKLKLTNSCAIHVRRGDYGQKKKFYSRLQVIGEDYYNRAIKHVLSNNFIFYLFSNDIEKASVLIKAVTGKQPVIINGDRMFTTLEEWYLMKCCQNQIIGNSTFSWWAAYLNDNKNKIVCAPSDYMGNDDILPKNWLKFAV